jgi:integrase
MGRPASIWWWEERQAYFANISGKRVKLGVERKAAEDEFYRLKGNPQQVVSTGTVWELMDKFLDFMVTRNASTYDWYKTRLQYFKDGLPNMPVRNIRPFHVQAWLDRKSGWSDGHKRGVVTAIKRVFSWAHKGGHLAENPITGLEKPAEGQRERVLSAKEVQAIIKSIKDENFRDLCLVVSETGCRPQEAIRVEARHIEGNCWKFPKNESKGKRRERLVFLSPKAKQITMKWAKRFPEGPIFRNRRNLAWTPNNVACRFQRMKDKLGHQVCLYQFRHAFTHHAITENGLDPVTTASLLGHTSVAMIMKTYGHLLKNEKFMLAAVKKAKG